MSTDTAGRAARLALEGILIIDVLACPSCAGRVRLVAPISDRQVIEKNLRIAGRTLPGIRPARAG